MWQAARTPELIVSAGRAASNDALGALFEDFIAALLDAGGYEFMFTRRRDRGGVQVDVEGRLKLFEIPLIAECKYHRKAITLGACKKFLGDYCVGDRARDGTLKLFVAVPRMTEEARAYFEREQASIGNTLRLLEGPQLVEALMQQPAVCEGLKAATEQAAAFGHVAGRKLLYTDRGSFWLLSIIRPGHAVADALMVCRGNGDIVAPALAQTFLADHDVQVSAMTLLGPKPAASEQQPSRPTGRITSKLARDAYEACRKQDGLTAKSLDGIRSVLGKFEGETGVGLLDADQSALAGWHNTQRDAGFTKATIQRNYYVLSRFFQYCVEHDLMPMNPAAALRTERPDTAYREEVRRLDWLEQLAGGLNDGSMFSLRESAIAATIMYAGLTTSEVVRMHFEHVDWEGGTLRVTGRWSRLIAIDPRLRPWLAAWTRAHPRSSGQLFQDYWAPYSPIKAEQVVRAVGNVVERAGLEREAFTPKAIRETYIAWRMAEPDVVAHKVQAFMGFKDVNAVLAYSPAMLQRDQGTGRVA